MKNTYLIKYVFLLLFVFSATIVFAQTGAVTGKVVDETNQPLPGATVTVKGTQQGAQTDAYGNFRLTRVSGTVTLQVTFVGYQSLEKTVNVSGNVTVNFNLLPTANDLNEVVVIGYGTEKKKDLTGAIATVTAKDFNTGDVTTPEQLIQGKVAGVSIISNDGSPGSGSQILIRGGASVNGSNQPLIVIDGVPLSNDAIAGASNPLDLINPNDIATFSILKDASAAAIYGNRASNGVIIITTKKGKAGKPVINFSTQLSVSKLTKEAPVLSANQFRTYIKANGDSAQIAQLGTANTDWQKEIYQTAVSNDNNLSVSGTTGILPYRVSVGYDDQNGILKTNTLNRYTVGLNLSPSFFTDHLKIDLNFLGSQQKQRFPNTGAIGSANSFNPTDPVYSGNKNFGGYYEILDPTSSDGLKSLAPLNPLGLLEEEQNRSTAYRGIGSLAADYKLHFFPDVHVNVSYGYDGSNGSGYTDYPAYAASQFPGTKDANGVLQQGSNTQYKSTVGNTTLDAHLSYSHDFKSAKSHVDAVAGYSDQNFSTTTYNYATYFGNGEVNPTTIPTYATGIGQYDLTSIYGRLNYAYDDKYLLTGTIRSDVSTRFAPGIRTATFPSVAGAWVLSNEDFLRGNNTLTNLKLRVGWGKTGNEDGIGDYEYLSDYSLSATTAQYQLGNTFYQYLRPGAFYPGRTWEQTATTNAGIDYGFLNGRISGSIDFYYRTTEHLLATISEPALTNFANSIIANVGNMQDKGVEFNITGELIATKDISWTANINMTINRNKITNLTLINGQSTNGLPTGGISGGVGTNIQINQVGLTKYSFLTYQQVYGANGKPLEGVYVDQNGDGQITSADLVANHSPDPQEYFGFNSDFRYKKWSIGFSARANFGNYVYNNIASSTGIQTNFLNGLGIIENGSSNVLKSGFTSAQYLSDYYLENASFFRMDNTHIGYNFGKVLKNTGDLKITGNVQNVFIITKYTGVDPESTTGIDNNQYPRPRTYTLGLNLTL
ncbi:SusC/RagA family TonB-linked outer membrane protein [Mucilaginibacter sp. E4BP6]|uniref:SusC/RagA family TonB-linked outer membrane protein n=1 Tax=Mucilaginibacter sp. E4BP6 TaxID=2723089 RepID=UPI0015CB6909|nr:SusC/RagA family TonB-linked outer membrane protein [Mucilaginibacter sp. E4BP6]NYE68471.1 iron complex outermembrane receptor protein [Mucilaginibacter sp. E4BP6]